jgi:hypothetical protein
MNAQHKINKAKSRLRRLKKKEIKTLPQANRIAELEAQSKK